MDGTEHGVVLARERQHTVTVRPTKAEQPVEAGL
jgi:hypothetical protein